MEQPLVSVLVPVYNHKDYIEECLQSLANQKTTFPFEVIVGDDCSPDGTQAVLRKLEQDLPDFFHIVYREKNIGALANGVDLYARSRGKYLLDFEGDDFILYDGMLQKEVDFLEEHPEYSACYANCVVVGADSKPNGEGYPLSLEEDYSWRENYLCTLPGHNGSRLCRKDDYLKARQDFLDLKEFDEYPGDRRNAFIFLCMGKVHSFQEPWTAYRHIKKGGSSHSANLKKDRAFADNEVGYGKTLVKYAQRYGNEEALLVAKQTWYRCRFRFCHGPVKRESLGAIVQEIMHEDDHRLLYLTSSVRWYVILALRMLRGRAII